MRLVRQPDDSNQCGQACVATLARISLKDAIKLCRTKGRTQTKWLIEALNLAGVETGTRLKRGFPDSGTAILKFTHPNGKSHWVVWHKSKYYDPWSGVTKHSPRYLRYSRITSHLEIYL